MSAEYILAEGNANVILCERGVRGFDSATRNLFDLSAIPVVKAARTCRSSRIRAMGPVTGTW